jgi:hypothetical protein
MFENLRLALKLVADAIKNRQLSKIFQQQVFYKRVAIPGYFDLTQLEISKDPLSGLDFRFVELKREDIEAGKWTFLASQRRLTALRHFKQGLRGFGLVDAEAVVVGDVWCLTPGKEKKPIQHPDLRMLEINCTAQDAYALDIFLPLSQRGKNLAVPVHRSLELLLKCEGCRRLYAYYWQDNIPSRWMHLMLKFNELPKIPVSRFFFIKTTHTVSSKGAPLLRIHIG